MNGGQAPPCTAEPTEVCPKGWWAQGKSEDTGQHLSHGIHCNGKCTGSAKSWMCADLNLLCWIMSTLTNRYLTIWLASGVTPHQHCFITFVLLQQKMRVTRKNAFMLISVWWLNKGKVQQKWVGPMSENLAVFGKYMNQGLKLMPSHRPRDIINCCWEDQ